MPAPDAPRGGAVGLRGRGVVLGLGTAQTVSWASSFYLPVLLAEPLAAEIGVAASTPFAWLSMALVLAALVAPAAGRHIDRHGGRPMLLASNALFVTALALMALAPGVTVLVLAWLLMGLGMAAGLYDAAFAALVFHHRGQARRAITGITLIAGFASTVGWPLTALMVEAWGWRGACWGWVALQLLVATPLNALLPRGRADEATAAPAPASAEAEATAAEPAGTSLREAPGEAAREAPLGLLVRVSLLFTLFSLVSTSVATHLPGILLALGVPTAAAVGLAALAGPAQVAARLGEWTLMRGSPPLRSARLAALGHPLGAGLVLLGGPAVAALFVVLHGLGNGLITIVRGTLPLALFGAAGYGARQGWIALPGRLLGALAPWGMGWMLEHWGRGALLATGACGALAFGLLLSLKGRAG